MEHNTATIDYIDFIYGILMGFYERVAEPFGFCDKNLLLSKEIRLNLIKKGFGPK